MLVRTVRVAECTLILFLLACAVASVTAHAQALHPGDLDTSWGDRGRALVLNTFRSSPTVGDVHPLTDGGAVATAEYQSGTRLVWLDLRGRPIRGHRRPNVGTGATKILGEDGRGRLLLRIEQLDTPPVLRRYHATGVIDATFGDRGSAAIPACRTTLCSTAFGIDLDGSVVVSVGSFDGNGGPRSLYRLDPNGEVDRSFGTHGRVTTGTVERCCDYEQPQVASGPNGTWYVAGYAARSKRGSVDAVIERYLPSGALDRSFGRSGSVRLHAEGSSLSVTSMTTDARGRVLIALPENAGSTIDATRLVRLTSSGSFDATFGRRGWTRNAAANGTGRLVLAGLQVRYYMSATFDANDDYNDIPGTAGVLAVDDRGRAVRALGPRGVLSDARFTAGVAADPARNVLWTASGDGLHLRALRATPSRQLGQRRSFTPGANAYSLELDGALGARGGRGIDVTTTFPHDRSSDGRGVLTLLHFTTNGAPSTGAARPQSSSVSVPDMQFSTTDRGRDGRTCVLAMTSAATSLRVLRLTNRDSIDPTFGSRTGVDRRTSSYAISVAALDARGCAILERGPAAAAGYTVTLFDDRGRIVASRLVHTNAADDRPDATLNQVRGELYLVAGGAVRRLDPTSLEPDPSFGEGGTTTIDGAIAVRSMPSSDGLFVVTSPDGAAQANGFAVLSHGGALSERRTFPSSSGYFDDGTDIIPLVGGGAAQVGTIYARPCPRRDCAAGATARVRRILASGELDRTFTAELPVDVDGGGVRTTRLVQLDRDRLAVVTERNSCYQGNIEGIMFVVRLTAGRGPATPYSQVATRGADHLVGSRSCDLLAGGPGNDVLDGLGDDDELRGGDGDDRLAGGTGTDQLLGGAGDDVLVGGPGSDVLRGGAGDDRIDARDGEVDFVFCGAGNDRATADAGDVVTGCERVQRG